MRLTVCHAGPWKGAAKIGELSVSLAATQGERRVISDLVGSVNPLVVQELGPGLRASAVAPRAFHSALGDLGTQHSSKTRSYP